MAKKKKKPNGCGIGCLTVIVIFLVIIIIGLVYGCQNSSSNTEEDQWVEQLIEEKQQAENLYAIDMPAEKKSAQALEKMNELEQQYTEIQEKTDKTQTDYPLIRAYVDVREMYVAIKNMAENIDYDNYYNEYFQANNEAAQIIQENYSD